jgi:hypothetical protein
MSSQTTIFSAEQEAINKAIYISEGKVATMIATDFLNTIMALMNKKPKNETNMGATYYRATQKSQ